MPTGARVLIVEDEAIAARAASVMLGRIGCTVTGVVDNGEDAIDAAARDHPDLVLMDIRLKGEMNGIEAATVIQERMGTPIVFVTAYSVDDLEDSDTLPEHSRFLSKPIGERELAAAIVEAMCTG
jgi:CheY-like chemotaxis protein